MDNGRKKFYYYYNVYEGIYFSFTLRKQKEGKRLGKKMKCKK